MLHLRLSLGEDAIVLPGLPSLTLSVAPDSLGLRIERWQVRGELTAATPDALEALKDSITGALFTPGVSVELRDESDVLRSLGGEGANAFVIDELRYGPCDSAAINTTCSYSIALHSSASASDPAGSALTSAESLHWQVQEQVVDHPLLTPGAGIYRQSLGPARVTLIQEGFASATGGWPEVADVLLPAALLEREVRYEAPSADGTLTTRWRYRCVPTTGATIAPPEL